MSRRRVVRAGLALAGLGILAACVPRPSRSHPARPFRIGYLGSRPLQPGVRPPGLAALHQGLQAFGHSDGQDFVIEVRSTEGRPERAPELLAEFLRLDVDLIYTSGTPNALAASRATSEIPVVVATNGDLVAVGLVSSLNRPGGNVTGVATLSPQLSGKRLELLREVAPQTSRPGMLASATTVSTGVEAHETRAAAQAAGLPLEIVAVGATAELPDAFGKLVDAGVDALMVGEDLYYGVNQAQVLALAAQHRLPAIYTLRDFVAGGGLMSYGANFVESHRRSAAHVDKIMKGARPADLPVEQPTTFELLINLNTARTLGLSIPDAVLQQATELIKEG